MTKLIPSLSALGLALAASLSVPEAAAQEPEGAFTCGTPDAPASALAKAADLPRVTRTWSGTLKALVIRISFSDAAYTTSDSTINKTNNTINTLYRTMSRNAFEWTWSIHPQILAAPGSRADYAANFSSLQSWITQQISAAGLKRGTDYDVYVAHFPLLNLSWAGLSNLRDADWINGTYGVGVTGHELGHSLGLPHAHSIEAGADMFGEPGTTSQTNEYGHPFDIMGRGGSTGHFNALYKYRIGWTDTAEIKEVKSSGIYRIYAQDNGAHKDRLLGIRVPAGDPDFAYWFEYRTVSTSARNGATVMFQGFKTPTNLDSWFLDTTPGSRTSNDENDGVLTVGKSFQDKYGNTTFTVRGINSGTWNENGYVDLEVVYDGMPVTLATFKGRSRIGSAGPAVDLLGRAVEASATLTAVKVDGVPRLEWRRP